MLNSVYDPNYDRFLICRGNYKVTVTEGHVTVVDTLLKAGHEINNVTNSISVKNIHLALEQLLDTYLSEKEESQRDDDTFFIGYWDSACQTIYDVAAALKIPLEKK